MIDLEIRYPDEIDILPFTTTVSVNIGDNINSLRAAILNLEEVLGLDVNIGLFTPTPEGATVADRLNRIERGIAERNLVFRELNVSDALQVQLDPNNEPFVNIGLGSTTTIAPVTIKGPLTILSPMLANPRTIIQTPVSIDTTTFNPEASASSLIRGKANSLEPLLRIHDTNDGYDGNALHVIGNLKVEGVLEAAFSIDHNQLLNIDTVPTDATRGEVKHVTQGDFHSHRKGRFDADRGTWIVDSSTSEDDFGVLDHSSLQGWGTLPTHDNSFTPDPNIKYHVTGGDLHTHSKGDGSQIDHNNLANIAPKLSNHVTGGDTHSHTSSGDGGSVSHTDLSDTGTTGTDALHVTGGDGHNHGLDEDGNPLGNGAQLDHVNLLNIDPASSNHVTGGDTHAHTDDGDGGKIDHINLNNIGTLTHTELDDKVATFRAVRTGSATFTSSSFDEIEIQHGMGTDSFNISWALAGVNTAPPTDPADVGTIYVADKNAVSFKLKRLGGSIAGPAEKAELNVVFSGADNDLLFVARSAGATGNDITVVFTEDASVAVGDITIIATTTGPSVEVRINAATTITAIETINAILADPVAVVLVDVFSSEGDGSGVVDGYASTNLSGGTDTSGFGSMEIEWIAVSAT